MSAPLVNGHGNFGSMDNDPPAAMRYTECKLRQLSQDMLLKDVEMDCVEFADTFDGVTRADGAASKVTERAH